MMKEYDEIQIPEELRDKVYNTARKAKNDRKQKMKKRIIGRVSGLAAAAVFGIIVLVNVSPSAAMAMEKLPVISGIMKVVLRQEYKNVRADKNAEADIKVPEVQVSGKSDSPQIETMNRQVKQYTDQIIAQYESEVRKMEGAEPSFYRVAADYEIVTDNDRMFSLRMNTEMTMADTNNCIKIYHIDKENGSFVKLKDLFRKDSAYIAVISENIKMQMKERMEEDPSQHYWLDEEEGWNFENISENVNFYVNKEGKLTIVFDKYEVAPGAMGVVEFVIPTKVLKDIVKRGYLK